VLPSIVVNGLLPFVAYQLLTGQGLDCFRALLATSVFPLVGVTWGWARTRQLDGIAVISLVFIALGLATSLISGDARFYLVKESFLTGLFGLVCLGSLLLPRPLMFYFGRQFASG
jgi:intracellular septation protein A